MKQFSMFSDEMLSQAFNNKNKASIINMVIQTINFDRSFSNGEFENLIALIKKEFPDVFETKELVEGEYVLPENEWDEDYFNHLLFNLRSNFCVERIDEVEETGKAIFKSNSNTINPTIPQLSEETPDQIKTETYNQKDPSTKTTQKNGKTNIDYKKLAIIMVIILLVVFVIIFVTRGKNINDNNSTTAVTEVYSIDNTEV